MPEERAVLRKVKRLTVRQRERPLAGRLHSILEARNQDAARARVLQRAQRPSCRAGLQPP